MNLFKKIKAFISLLIIQLAFAPIVLAINIGNQDEKLVGKSGLVASGDLTSIISTLIQVFLGFLGVIFLALTLMAGFKWMTAQGNEEEVKKAQGSMKNSIMGLVIVLAAYAITYSVFKYLPFGGSGSGSMTTTP